MRAPIINCIQSYLFFALVYQFRKNKVREYTNSDSDCDEYDQEDRGLILRQVPDTVTFCLPRGRPIVFFLVAECC